MADSQETINAGIDATNTMIHRVPVDVPVSSRPNPTNMVPTSPSIEALRNQIIMGPQS